MEIKEKDIIKTKENKTTRNSSIELLKIIAIMLIVISHSVPLYGDNTGIGFINLKLATTDITNFLLVIFRSLGHIGNSIFIICSAYFLIDSNKTKKEKIINIIVDSFTISVIFLGVILVSGFNLPIKEIIKQFFPIIFGNNWFICAYLLLYTVHPLLNIIIKNLNKKQLLRLVLTLLFLYCGIQFILPGRLQYNTIIGFIMIYFVVAYVKLYMPKFQKSKKTNITVFFTAGITYILILVITNLLGLKFEMFSNKLMYWDKLSNIFFISIAISLFNIFNNRYFENKFINYYSSLSLIIYLIHENVLFRDHIRPLFYNNVFKYGNILLWVILEAIILFVGATILSAIYKETIQKLTKKLSKKIGDVFTKHYLKLESKML